MKTMKTLATTLLCLALISTSSCKVHLKKNGGHDNGKHKGWYKNPNNPHHPNSTNPGHTKKSSGNSGNSNGNPGKSNGKGNSKK